MNYALQIVNCWDKYDEMMSHFVIRTVSSDGMASQGAGHVQEEQAMGHCIEGQHLKAKN